MMPGSRVRIVCPDHERGTVCDGWGYTTTTIVTQIRSGSVAWLQGVTRPFTMRNSRKWVMRGYRDGRGPYLKELP